MSRSKLKMIRSDLTNLPEWRVPEGCSLRDFEPGDEPVLAELYGLCGLGLESAEAVREGLLAHESFAPHRLLLLVRDDDGSLLGSAGAWIDREDPALGFLHMLAVLPEHRGRGLGRLLTLATLERNGQEGARAQWLLTDDERLPAIRLYLELGYDPLFVDASHPGRWRALADRLGRPEIVSRGCWQRDRIAHRRA